MNPDFTVIYFKEHKFIINKNLITSIDIKRFCAQYNKDEFNITINFNNRDPIILESLSEQTKVEITDKFLKP